MDYRTLISLYDAHNDAVSELERMLANDLTKQLLICKATTSR